MSFLSIEDFSINLDLVSSIEAKFPDVNYSTRDGNTLSLRIILKNGRTQFAFLKNENYDDLYKQLNEVCFKFRGIYFMRDSILFLRRTSKKTYGNDKACIELITADGSDIYEIYDSDEEAEFKFSISQAILNSKGDKKNEKIS